MKSSKVMAALVTLGLAAAVATPAMALENQFSGSFTSFYDISNYSASGVLAKDAATQNYFVQRVRLGYTAKASDDVKLVTKFELDYNWYGNNSYDNTRGGGAALGADGINLETKNLYLDLNVAKGLNAKIGMQPYNDSFKGIIFDADMAGVLLSHEYEKASITAGFFRFADRTKTAADLTTIGKYTQDMFSLDAKYNIAKEIKVGAAYYYFGDNRDPAKEAKVHNVGINFDTELGHVTLSGFGLAQFGDITNTQKAKGFALNVGAKMPVAGGTARTEFLYAGGGKNALYVPASDNGGTEGGGFYDAEMIMLNRDKNATTIDNAIVYDSNNVNGTPNLGVIMGSIGFDYPITTKLSGSVNAGFAAVAKDTAAAGVHKSNYLGTEVNCEANYKLMPTVTLGARAGYVVLGDYFKGTSFDNPYDVKLIAKFAF
jgi:hypothetical protein